MDLVRQLMVHPVTCETASIHLLKMSWVMACIPYLAFVPNLIVMVCNLIVEEGVVLISRVSKCKF